MMADQQSTDLTVQKTPKIEENHQELLKEVKGLHPFFSYVKWVFTGFLFLSVLGCLVFSKISAFKLAESLDLANRSFVEGWSSEKLQHLEEQGFIMIIIILTIPYCWTALWSSRKLFNNGYPWPSVRSIILGLVFSTVEVFGQSLFMLHVLPRFQNESHFIVLLMGCVLVVPIGFSLIRKFYKPASSYAMREERFMESSRTNRYCCNKSKLDIIAQCIAALCLFSGIALLSYYFFSDYPYLHKERRTDAYDKFDLLSLILSTASLSIAWLPAVHKLQIEPNEMPNCSRIDQQATGKDNIKLNTPVECWGRWKSGFINSLYKIILCPVMCFMIAFVLTHLDPKHTVHIDLKKLRSSTVFENWPSHYMFAWFLVNIFTSSAGYHLGTLACVMGLQKISFALPLCLSMPVSYIAMLLVSTCQPRNLDEAFIFGECKIYDIQPHIGDTGWAIPIVILLCTAQILSTVVDVWKSQAVTVILEESSNLFWVEGYSSVFLEHWMLLNKKTVTNDASHDQRRKAPVKVYICTTMYREAEHEMEQLLRSIAGVNIVQQARKAKFESHIFLDNGCKGKALQEFALQLTSLIEQTLGVKITDCIKLETPYGMKLSWQLPGRDESPDSGMIMSIHLKDNLKVKNKKRWSQVMYMSLVLDYLLPLDGKDSSTYTSSGNSANTGVIDSKDNAFILTTDADVEFSPESVEALLDLMISDSTAGAACGRTHPKGSGPVVWYQKFDYAIGHWFQKAANHVLGSVLCSPGCFSVYRVKAIEEILPIYASNVEKASEFLTKDMGEDRWFCTLLVQSGWNLKYCALANDATYCPEDFDEFFKQRRRWIPSTLANQVLLLQHWSEVRKFNSHITMGFLFYQALLLLSTLISPSMSILVIAGGVQYGLGISPLLTMALTTVICLAYGFICLKADSKTQLLVAKALTYFFALVMTTVAVGVATQIAEQLSSDCQMPTLSPPHKNISFSSVSDDKMCDDATYTLIANSRVDTSTLYLAILSGIFIFAAMLHPSEFFCLLHGTWYILCFPSGFLLLMIYSLCNITDRSWGTREEKQKSSNQSQTVGQRLSSFVKTMRRLCSKDNKLDDQSNSNDMTTEDLRSVKPLDRALSNNADTEGNPMQPKVARESGKALEQSDLHREESLEESFYYKSVDFRNDMEGFSQFKPIDEWLDCVGPFLKTKYLKLFLCEGFEDVSFLAGTTEEELKQIGVKDRYDRSRLLDESHLLEGFSHYPKVPNTVSGWLKDLRLQRYKEVFSLKGIDDSSPKAMERLKEMSKDDIKQNLKVKKIAHLRRLMEAIEHVRFPNTAEEKRRQTNEQLKEVRFQKLSSQEEAFWENLVHSCLKPKSQLFEHELDMKAQLKSLRNSTLVAFLVTNTLWLAFSVTLDKSKVLKVLATNPLGLSFLIVFGILIVIQFFCMLAHRVWTVVHTLARAQFRPSKPMKNTFSFRYDRLEDIEDEQTPNHTGNRQDYNQSVVV